MAKYKFDFTDFNLADLAEFLRLSKIATPKQSLANLLFDIKEIPNSREQVGFMADLLALIGKFTDGYKLSNVPLSDISILVKDFMDALIILIKEEYGEGT